MKALLIVLCCLAIVQVDAQTKVEKTVAIKPGQKLQLDMDRPDLVLHTWDKPEVLIKGTVSINQGENDNAFSILVSQVDGAVVVSSELKDEDNIPKRVVIKSGDKEYRFKATGYDDPEVQKFLEAEGRNYSYMSVGIQVDVDLEIFVPRNLETVVYTKYGAVEVRGFDAPLAVNTKYGVVDVAVPAQSVGQLVARARYGEILSNLDIRFDERGYASKKSDQWTEVSAQPGKGPAYRFESKYGNVYLRKP